MATAKAIAGAHAGEEVWFPKLVKPARFEAEYTLISKLGEGAFSEVLLCEQKTAHTREAAKVIRKKVGRG